MSQIENKFLDALNPAVKSNILKKLSNMIAPDWSATDINLIFVMGIHGDVELITGRKFLSTEFVWWDIPDDVEHQATICIFHEEGDSLHILKRKKPSVN